MKFQQKSYAHLPVASRTWVSFGLAGRCPVLPTGVERGCPYTDTEWSSE